MEHLLIPRSHRPPLEPWKFYRDCSLDDGIVLVVALCGGTVRGFASNLSAQSRVSASGSTPSVQSIRTQYLVVHQAQTERIGAGCGPFTRILTMPPRIPISQAKTCLRPSNASQTPPQSLVSLFAAISIQSRNANILADLRDTKGAYHKRIRVGRGPSSGYGKTSGRGHNGQLQKGKIKPWFQGGQTPLIQVRGRKGIDNVYVSFKATGHWCLRWQACAFL
jgi:hypothetical protein